MKKLFRSTAVAFAILTCALGAQLAKDANERYRTSEGRESVAKGLGSPDRDARQKPRELVNAMELQPGMTVADIGTGVGYMLPFLSQAVGPQGRVLAEDIFDDFLQKARETARQHNLQNVTFVKGAEADPNLPENAVDVILALDSYHHYNYPSQMLSAFHRALRPGGHLVIVEYYRRPNAMGRNGFAMQHIRLDEPDLVKEVESNGFHLISKREQIKDSQYMVTFERQ